MALDDRCVFAMSARRWAGAARAVCVLAALVAWPDAAAAQKKLTEFAVDIGGAARYTVGAEAGLDAELFGSLSVLRVGDDSYRGIAVELSYAGNEDLEFFAILPRVEFGLGAPHFNHKSAGRGASAWLPYLAVTAGYGSGTVWDTEFIELYGSDEAVAVDISGVPMYGAVGFRRIGGLTLRAEVVGGLILVTSEEADLPEGDAPSVIPSVGVRFAIGADSFTYVWR